MLLSQYYCMDSISALSAAAAADDDDDEFTTATPSTTAIRLTWPVTSPPLYYPKFISNVWLER